MREFIATTKALSDENRVRALLALRGREVCVCHIVELLELAPSTVSKHMSILRQANLVESRKDGRWIYYRLTDDAAPAMVRHALDWVDAALAGLPQTRADEKRLKAILRSSKAPC